METRITSTELARSLSDVLNRVRYRGEQFVIVRNGEPVATLAPTEPARGITWRELIEFLKENPFPDEDFAKDLEEIRSSQPLVEEPPWD